LVQIGSIPFFLHRKKFFQLLFDLKNGKNEKIKEDKMSIEVMLHRFCDRDPRSIGLL
jgi:hypothetical protein